MSLAPGTRLGPYEILAPIAIRLPERRQESVCWGPESKRSVYFDHEKLHNRIST
jgi:hypothetical protein